MSSSHRARGLPLFLAPPPIPNIIDFSKLSSLRMICPKYDRCCFFINASSGLCVSRRFDTWQIVYLSNKDPCPKISSNKIEIKVQ